MFTTDVKNDSRPCADWFTVCSAAGLAFALAGAAQAETYSFNFDLNQGQGSGLISLDGPSDASVVRLNDDSAGFTAAFEFGGQVWSEEHYRALFPNSIGLEQDEGGDWYWNDGAGEWAELEVIAFDNDQSILSFDEGDEGSRVFRIDGEPAGDYLAVRAEPEPEPEPQPGPRPQPAPQPEPEPEPEPQPQINPVEVLRRVAFTENTQSAATAIGTACPRVVGSGTQFSEDCTTLVVAAASEVARLEQNTALALHAVTNEQATVPLSSSRASLSTQLQNLSSRLAALRGGATGLSVRGLVTTGLADEPYAYGGGAASADGNDVVVFGDERIGIFVNGTYSTGDKDATANEDGFNFDTWGLTAGVDYRFTEDLVFGLAMGYSENDTQIDRSGGNLDTNTFSTSLYGTYYANERLYIDGILTYSNNDYDQKRKINYSIGDIPVQQTASADYDGSQWSAAIGGGYQLSDGPWSYGPTLRLEYLSASVDAYAEKISDPNRPGGGWAARLNKLDHESLSSSMGFDVARAVSMDWGVLSPQLNLSWIHEFKDDALAVNGTFVEDPHRHQFNIIGDRPDSDYFNARVAVAAQMAGGTSAFLYYNKVFGYKDLDVDSVGAGVRMAF